MTVKDMWQMGRTNTALGKGLSERHLSDLTFGLKIN